MFPFPLCLSFFTILYSILCMDENPPGHQNPPPSPKPSTYLVSSLWVVKINKDIGCRCVREIIQEKT